MSINRNWRAKVKSEAKKDKTWKEYAVLSMDNQEWKRSENISAFYSTPIQSSEQYTQQLKKCVVCFRPDDENYKLTKSRLFVACLKVN